MLLIKQNTNNLDDELLDNSNDDALGPAVARAQIRHSRESSVDSNKSGVAKTTSLNPLKSNLFLGLKQKFGF